MFLLYLTGLALLMAALIQSILWLRHRHLRAQATLVSFTHTESEWSDDRYAYDDKFGAIEEGLVREAHLWARRGLRIATRLLHEHAIDQDAYDRICTGLGECLAEHERREVMRRLPSLRCGDREWREFLRDGKLLQRYTTHTYWIAYNDPETI